MSNIIYQPYLSDTRAPSSWEPTVDHSPPTGCLSANGVGLMWGEGASLRRTTNGRDWAPVLSTVLGDVHIRSIVWADDKWMGCGVDTQYGLSRMFYSPDGLTWIKITSFVPVPTFQAHQLIWGGGRVVVIPKTTVGTGSNFVYYSYDLVAWTKTNAGQCPTNVTFGTTSNAGIFFAGLYITLNGVSANGLWSSSDALTWTNRVASGGSNPSLMTNGSMAFMCGGGGVISYSYNGTAWTTSAQASTGSSSWSYKQILIADSRLIAIGGKAAVWSTNGVNWSVGPDVNPDQFSLGCYIDNLLAVTTGDSHAWSSDYGTTYYSYGVSAHRTLSTAGYSSNMVSYASGLLFYLSKTGGRLQCSNDGGVTWASTHLNLPSATINNLGIYSFGAYLVAINPFYLGVYVSTDGIYWTPRPAVGTWRFSNSFYMYGAATDGSRFVVVGTYYVAYSSDLTNWTSVTLSGSPILRSPIWDGNQFMAGGPTGVYTSPNGATWTLRAISGTNQIQALVYTGTLYVAANANGVIYTSPTGTVWTNRITYAATALNCMVIGSGGRIVVVGNKGHIAYSDDNGLTWTTAISGITSYLNILAITWDGSKYWITTSSVTVAFRAWSTDGISWTVESTEYGTVSNVKLQADGTTLQAVSALSTYLESVDYGITWKPTPMAVTVLDMAKGSGSSVVCINGTQYISSADNGITWSAATTFPAGGTTFNSVNFGAGVFVASGNPGYAQLAPTSPAMQSSNGAVGSWGVVASPSPTTTHQKYVNTHWFGNAHYRSGSIDSYYVTVNFGNITPPGTTTAQVWYDFTYGSSTYVSVGVNGNIVTASNPSDQSNWVRRATLSTATLTRVCFGDGVFVAVGPSVGHFSYDSGESWRISSFPLGAACAGVVWADDKFIAISANGSRAIMEPPPP